MVTVGDTGKVVLVCAFVVFCFLSIYNANNVSELREQIINLNRHNDEMKTRDDIVVARLNALDFHNDDYDKIIKELQNKLVESQRKVDESSRSYGDLKQKIEGLSSEQIQSLVTEGQSKLREEIEHIRNYTQNLFNGRTDQDSDFETIRERIDNVNNDLGEFMKSLPSKIQSEVKSAMESIKDAGEAIADQTKGLFQNTPTTNAPTKPSKLEQIETAVVDGAKAIVNQTKELFQTPPTTNSAKKPSKLVQIENAVEDTFQTPKSKLKPTDREDENNDEELKETFDEIANSVRPDKKPAEAPQKKPAIPDIVEGEESVHYDYDYDDTDVQKSAKPGNDTVEAGLNGGADKSGLKGGADKSGLNGGADEVDPKIVLPLNSKTGKIQSKKDNNDIDSGVYSRYGNGYHDEK